MRSEARTSDAEGARLPPLRPGPKAELELLVHTRHWAGPPAEEGGAGRKKFFELLGAKVRRPPQPQKVLSRNEGARAGRPLLAG